VLSSLVVEHLQTLKPASPVLCLYLEYNPATEHTKENLLGSLVKQMVQFRKPGISLGIRKAFGKTKARPSYDDLCLLLKASEYNSLDKANVFHIYITIHCASGLLTCFYRLRLRYTTGYT